MITIVADEGNGQIGAELFRELSRRDVEGEYISLEGVQVKPCISCGGCTYKTYGRCVTRDDGDWIYPQIIKADVLIFVTPITYGSYSLKSNV
jgi:Multimeric flavodoxin WrbA